MSVESQDKDASCGGSVAFRYNGSPVAATNAALRGPTAVAVDAAGDILIADWFHFVNREVNASTQILSTMAGTAQSCPNPAASPACGNGGLATNATLSNVEGVAIDGAGNLYITDFNDNRIRKVTVGAARFSFATTAVGSTSSDSPQTLTLENIGNAPLTFPAPTSGSNPSISTNFILDPSLNTCPVTASEGGAGTLAQGTSCTVAIDFAPVAAGSISGSPVLTDNDLNATGAMQTIALGGTATQQTPTFSTMSFSPAATEAYGTSQTLIISDMLVYTGSGAVPTGAVTFVLSGVSCTASCTGSSSPLTCAYAVPAATIAALPLAAYTVTAAYTADSNYSAATGASGTFTITQVTQAITFTPSSPVTYEVAPITLTATGGASGNPVTFSIVTGGSYGSLSGTNNGVLTVTGTGTIVIAADQAGSSNYAAATQITRIVVVNPAAPTVTAVSAVTSAYGSTTGITVTATESGSAGVATGGIATFSVISPATGSFTVATCTLSVAGACTSTYTPTGTLAAGTYTGDIKASFAAVGNYTAANGAATLTVNHGTPDITLAASVNSILVQSAITFTATVTSAIGTPTGTVIFMDGATPLRTGAIVNGVDAFTTSTLAVGAHTITAVYSGDTNFITVTSSAQTETVLNFTLSISNGADSVTSVTVEPGGTAIYIVAIGPVGSAAFPATIRLSASGLPPGATYIISPATLDAGSGAQTVTLTIQLPPSIAVLHQGNGMNKLVPFALVLLLLPFAGRMRKRAKRFDRTTWIIFLLIASGAATMAGVAGCGGNGYFAQPPATYTVSLTGSSGNLSYATPLTLTVE